MDTNNFNFKFITSIDQVNRQDWNLLIETDYPFIRHEFLQALESSGCVCPHTGWQPYHLLVYLKDTLVAIMPLYIKTHSYGEYVFDFQWANAFHQTGLDYYPKLLSAIPFTPCAGDRLYIKAQYREILQPAIFEQVVQQAKKLNASSWHLLFPDKELSRVKQQSDYMQPALMQSDLIKPDLIKPDLMKRCGMQYHWFNHGYQSFSDFLASCKMKSRKNIKRERRIVNDAAFKLRILEGDEITPGLWRTFYYFYQRTYAKRSGNDGYLNLSFFENIGLTMPSKLMMVVAELDGEVIAASLFFKGGQKLYGRYWGASAEYELLHFEACYYQGIEYCIEQGIDHFDAGAQGEHKIQRGFQPIETYSYHWVSDERFRHAIENFVEQESLQVKAVIKELSKKLPFK
jgi:predicted N-acyltransferase